MPGLGGEIRRKALVSHFGSLARLRQASVEEIITVPGIGTATAAAVLEALGGVTVDSPVSAAPEDPVGKDQSAEQATR